MAQLNEGRPTGSNNPPLKLCCLVSALGRYKECGGVFLQYLSLHPHVSCQTSEVVFYHSAWKHRAWMITYWPSPGTAGVACRNVDTAALAACSDWLLPAIASTGGKAVRTECAFPDSLTERTTNPAPLSAYGSPNAAVVCSAHLKFIHPQYGNWQQMPLLLTPTAHCVSSPVLDPIPVAPTITLPLHLRRCLQLQWSHWLFCQCLCVQVYTRVCQRSTLGVLSGIFIFIIYCTRASRWPEVLPSRLGWPASEFQMSTCLYFSNPGITHLSPQPTTSHLYLGSGD